MLNKCKDDRFAVQVQDVQWCQRLTECSVTVLKIEGKKDTFLIFILIQFLDQFIICISVTSFQYITQHSATIDKRIDVNWVENCNAKKYFGQGFYYNKKKNCFLTLWISKIHNLEIGTFCNSFLYRHKSFWMCRKFSVNSSLKHKQYSSVMQCTKHKAGCTSISR